MQRSRVSVNFVKEARGSASDPRHFHQLDWTKEGTRVPYKKQNVPFVEACRWVGGEENLKKLKDPTTGEAIWSEDWRSKRSRWYKYKKQGVPAEVMWVWAIERINSLEESLKNYALQAGDLTTEASERIQNMSKFERQILLAQMRELIRRALEE